MKTPTEKQMTKINSALYACGVQKFRGYDDAQSELYGRTHWADTDTLKYFGARLNGTRHLADNLILVVDNSVAPPNAARSQRVTVFDCFGTVIFCTGRHDREHGSLSRPQAEKLFQEWLKGFSVAAHYLATLRNMAKEYSRKASVIRTALK